MLTKRIRKLLSLASTAALLWTLSNGGALAEERSLPIGTPFLYKTVDGKNLTLFVNEPEGWKPADHRPAIVFFHGGGWTSGSAGVFDEMSRYLAARGMVCIAPEYRLLGSSPAETPLICIQDAKSAMRWVRSHAADLGIDPDRIASGGASAGGHLAAFVGMMDGLDDEVSDDLTVSARSAAMVLYNPTLNNGPEGFGFKRIGDNYRSFSPAHNVTPDDPPAIVFLGTQDKVIPVDLLIKFQKSMKEAGVRCDLHLFEGQGHSFWDKKANAAKVMEMTSEFFQSLGWLNSKN